MTRTAPFSARLTRAAGDRGHAEIDVPRGDGDGDGLRRLEEGDLGVDSLVLEVAAVHRDEGRRLGGESRRANGDRVGGLCAGRR